MNKIKEKKVIDVTRIYNCNIYTIAFGSVSNVTHLMYASKLIYHVVYS
jgi:hypothetical protein